MPRRLFAAGATGGHGSPTAALRRASLRAFALIVVGLCLTFVGACHGGWTFGRPPLRQRGTARAEDGVRAPHEHALRGAASTVFSAVPSNASTRGARLSSLSTAWLVAVTLFLASSPLGAAAADWVGTHLSVRSVEEAVAQVHLGGRLEMARYPDPVLRMKAAPVANFSMELGEMAAALAEVAHAEGAVGLAANQVGVDARIIALDPALLEPGDAAIFVNPRIVDRTPEVDMRWWRERCLVLPEDVRVTLMRDAGVTVRAEDVAGRTHVRRLNGEAARAFQHELDHLDGILILDHAADPEELGSQLFADLRRLEEPDHPWRQSRAMARIIFEQGSA